jgi:endo-1,4-beta-D-glucanase Y
MRRSDKIRRKEMSQVYTLKQYFVSFDADARRANIKVIYINSEEVPVFSEFVRIKTEKQGYLKLLSVKATRNVVYVSFIRMSRKQHEKIVLEFLRNIFI